MPRLIQNSPATNSLPRGIFGFLYPGRVDASPFQIFANPRGSFSGEGRVGYRGPLGRSGNSPRIKLDLVHDEVLVLDPVRRRVHHPYSDEPEGGIDSLCYAFEEVFAEKVRALAERQRPRDLYDVIHLHRRRDLVADHTLVLSTLRRKCAFKAIPAPTFIALEGRPERQDIEAEWDTMLAHQLPACPPFGQFWAALPEVFAWLEDRMAPAVELPSIPAPRVNEGEVWHAPPMATRWGYSTPLEAIRYAAANRLLVELGYQGSRRAIEPYSLRRTRANELLLYAVRHAEGEVRAYRVDRIESATVTRDPFTPRYLIELTHGGPISAPFPVQ